jgi:hypothetical protein
VISLECSFAHRRDFFAFVLFSPRVVLGRILHHALKVNLCDDVASYFVVIYHPVKCDNVDLIRQHKEESKVQYRQELLRNHRPKTKFIITVIAYNA